MKRLITVITLFTALAASAAPGRRIFINGTDISSARDQFVKNVDVRISESGDVYITAPHYQVHQEETFTPLSSYQKKQEDAVPVKPEHKAQPGPLPTATPGAMPISDPRKLPEVPAASAVPMPAGEPAK